MTEGGEETEAPTAQRQVFPCIWREQKKKAHQMETITLTGGDNGRD